MDEKVIHKDLSYKLMGILFKVHGVLGNRLHERYYERAIALALRKENIKFDRQISVDINYDGEKIGTCRLDFVIDGKIVLELKSEPRIMPAHIRQVPAYLKSNDLKLGIVANFRTESLTFQRVLNSG